MSIHLVTVCNLYPGGALSLTSRIPHAHPGRSTSPEVKTTYRFEDSIDLCPFNTKVTSNGIIMPMDRASVGARARSVL